MQLQVILLISSSNSLRLIDYVKAKQNNYDWITVVTTMILNTKS
jgi:hypothetical protein